MPERPRGTVTAEFTRDQAKNLLAWSEDSAVDIDVHLCEKLRAALDGNAEDPDARLRRELEEVVRDERRLLTDAVRLLAITHYEREELTDLDEFGGEISYAQDLSDRGLLEIFQLPSGEYSTFLAGESRKLIKRAFHAAVGQSSRGECLPAGERDSRLTKEQEVREKLFDEASIGAVCAVLDGEFPVEADGEAITDYALAKRILAAVDSAAFPGDQQGEPR